MARPCPCGRKLTFETCCGPRLSGAAPAPTAVDLMRSRFTAYGEGAVDYLIATTAPESRWTVDAGELTAYCAALRLMKLEILETQAGGAADDAGFVHFRATLRHRGEKFTQTERSRFRREAGAWVYVDGEAFG
jgi:SEC-C motif-containing protein